MKKNQTSPLQISRVTLSTPRVRTGIQAGTLFPPFNVVGGVKGR